METSDRNALRHLGPTMPLHELIEDAFQRDAVQRIARMIDGFGHNGDMLRKVSTFVKALCLMIVSLIALLLQTLRGDFSRLPNQCHVAGQITKTELRQAALLLTKQLAWAT